MTAEALDEVILEILLKSEHGRKWLERRAEREAMTRRLRNLQRSGLSREIVGRLWVEADMGTIDKIATMTPAQIKAINREYRARRPYAC